MARSIPRLGRVPANRTQRVDLSNYVDDNIVNEFVSLENKLRWTTSNLAIAKPYINKGSKVIKISSDRPITAYYEISVLYNMDLISLKGNNALGKQFYVPFQTTHETRSYPYLNRPYSSIDIVATEDNTKIKVTSKSGNEGIKAVKAGRADFAMLARTLNDDEKGLWPIAVGRDAVVAIINVNNPSLQNILNWGIDKAKFKKIFVSGGIKNWKDVYKNKNIDEPIKVYKLSNENCASKTWAQFVETDPDELLGEAFDLDSRLINAVKMDRNSIGFINLAFAYDNYTKYEHSELTSGTLTVPRCAKTIDFNGNELIDDDEFFYHNKNRLLDAVKDERFKRPPGRTLYLVSEKKPADALSKTFIKWILTTGMNFMKDAGYVMLDQEECTDIIKNL